jgi:hypothetical protein
MERKGPLIPDGFYLTASDIREGLRRHYLDHNLGQAGNPEIAAGQYATTSINLLLRRLGRFKATEDFIAFKRDEKRDILLSGRLIQHILEAKSPDDLGKTQEFGYEGGQPRLRQDRLLVLQEVIGELTGIYRQGN